tara:strand:+ start:308 stop:514 length:207 start_codon:yes stop_codon:yes gene_type:complete
MADNIYFSNCELVVLVGAVGGILLTALSCILKSRCSLIKCGCIEIKRDVIGEANLSKANLNNNNNNNV